MTKKILFLMLVGIILISGCIDKSINDYKNSLYPAMGNNTTIPSIKSTSNADLIKVTYTNVDKSIGVIGYVYVFHTHYSGSGYTCFFLPGTSGISCIRDYD